MPRTTRTTARTLAPLAAIALSVTGCAAIEPLETTGIHEVVTGLSSEVWCDTGDDARLPEGGVDLRGPHFSTSFLCHFAGTEAPENIADDVEDLAELPQLIGGTELLINQLAFSPTYDPEFGHDSVAAWIEADGAKIELGYLPARGSYIAVSVPVGGNAVLWVEDDGRAQGLDFRTGERIAPVDQYYEGPGLGTEQTESFEYEAVKFSNERGTWTIDCASNLAEITRTVWLEDHGWASDDSVFLTVEFWWCTGDEYDDRLVWTLDREKALLASADSKIVQPSDWSEERHPRSPRGMVSTVVFQVPADAAELTVVFSPVGTLTDKETGETFKPLVLPELTVWEVEF